ncbi:MAG TPA: hypothetical protein VMT14_06640, partial [Burkholderiaceae bacterium]|nr:hypothetical protein [Burkholderiaceae bacterium]
MPLAAALNAPPPHGFSSVRPWRAGLSLALLRFSPRHKSPTPDITHRAASLMVFVNEDPGGAGNAAVGYASAATLRGAED